METFLWLIGVLGVFVMAVTLIRAFTRDSNSGYEVGEESVPSVNTTSLLTPAATAVVVDNLLNDNSNSTLPVGDDTVSKVRYLRRN